MLAHTSFLLSCPDGSEKKLPGATLVDACSQALALSASLGGARVEVVAQDYHFYRSGEPRRVRRVAASFGKEKA